jgi:hypothetical protein
VDLEIGLLALAGSWSVSSCSLHAIHGIDTALGDVFGITQKKPFYVSLDRGAGVRRIWSIYLLQLLYPSCWIGVMAQLIKSKHRRVIIEEVMTYQLLFAV